MKPALTLPVIVGVIVGTSSVSAFGCKPAEITGWMASCDSVAGGSKAKCDNRACHTALHRLVEQETINCYVSSNMGTAGGLQKYKALDDFCRGEGPDPETTPVPTTIPQPLLRQPRRHRIPTRQAEALQLRRPRLP